jgi:hypothetical protein
MRILLKDLLVGDRILSTENMYGTVTHVEELGNLNLYCVSVNKGPGLMVQGNTPIIIEAREQDEN